MRTFLPSAIFLLLTLRLCAHQDPVGDLRPEVRVENGNFAIYFESGLEHRGLNEDPPPLRMVYSPAGELLAPRHHVSKVLDNGTSGSRHGAAIAVPDGGDHTLMFPPYPRMFHGKPYYTSTTNGRIQRYRLPWPDGVKIDELHAVVADAQSVTIAAKAGTELLSIYHFSRAGFALPAVVEIGTPVTIYNFPVASNIVQAGGGYWIAWMRGNEEKRKFEAVLSSWKPGDAQAVTVVLDAPADWNAHLSMAASGDILCLAYHCSVTGQYPGQSRIVTIFHKMK